MLPKVSLVPVTREDVKRIILWLEDEEVNSSWYGLDEQGVPLHVGYSPHEIVDADEKRWKAVFADPERQMFSVYFDDDQHIGEGQIVLEPLLHSAQLFILVGRKDMWFRGFGTAAMAEMLDMVFYTHEFHRAWVDIPEYNKPALHMCENIGFVLEGHLRGRHPKGDIWYDTIIMGLLTDEYARRRTRLLEKAENSST